MRDGQQLESHLTRPRLEILRNQLQPHFLFHALQAVATLMHRNVEAADEMLAHLGDLLRLSLERQNVQEASSARGAARHRAVPQHSSRSLRRSALHRR